ncbi:MAG: hypothetical protein IJH76_04330 [Clostridia bacterium]|nr:hypothetical protein [Clostridia bacterium]
MHNSNLPEVKRESIFIKIKNWFKNIFNKNESRDIQEKYIIQNEGYDTTLKSNFRNEIQVKEDATVILMKKFEKNNIDISELTDTELDDLIALYKEKIKEKKEKIKLYKAKFVSNGGF